MERGFKKPVGHSYLQRDEVWKFGVTKNPSTRYSQSWLSKNSLLYETELSGTRVQALQLERMKLLNYKGNYLELQAGNKILR
jgi:hypothetical protein